MSNWSQTERAYIEEPRGRVTGPVGEISCHHCGEDFHLSLPECPHCSHKTLTWANPELCPPCITHIGPDLTEPLRESIKYFKALKEREEAK